MRLHLRYKLIGTGAFIVVLTALVAATTSFADARFFSALKNVLFDGIVTATSTDTVTLDTNADGPITVKVIDKTQFGDGLSNIGDISPSDELRVIARREGGILIAHQIRRTNQGYGTTAGDNVIVSNGHIVGIGADTLTVANGNSTVIFHITPDTHFLGGSFGSLEIDDNVHITGIDTGSEFVAKTVLKFKHAVGA